MLSKKKVKEHIEELEDKVRDLRKDTEKRKFTFYKARDISKVIQAYYDLLDSLYHLYNIEEEEEED